MNIESFDLYNPPSDFIDNAYKYYNSLREFCQFIIDKLFNVLY